VFKLILTILTGSILTIACVGGGSNSGPIVISDEFYCERVERTNIDFTVLNDVVRILEQNSVFQETIRDPNMLLQGTIERLFAFLGVRPSQIPSWVDELVDEEVARAEQFRQTPDFSIIGTITERLALETRPDGELRYPDFQDPERIESLLQASIEGIIETVGDPFANYVSTDIWKAGLTSNTGQYRGIGISISTNERGEISISSVSQGGPAEAAGLKPGDAIVRVDGKLTTSCTIRHFITKVRARENPKIELLIRDALTDEERVVLVTMEIIQERAVSSCPPVNLEGGRGDTLEDLTYSCPFLDVDGSVVDDILYLKIRKFTVQAAQDVKSVLEAQDWGKIRGIIVDVRGNPGGRVDATLDTIDYFLPEDDVIFIRETANGTRTYEIQDETDLVPEYITIVVIAGNDDNGNNSYSGSEVFAAALRDNGRALLISREARTGGKATINRDIPLRGGNYGAIYIAIEKWLTPSGEFIENQDLDGDGYDEIGGLHPDVRVNWTSADILEHGRNVNYDPTLFEAIDQIRGASAP